jgi:hypothetical protein
VRRSLTAKSGPAPLLDLYTAVRWCGVAVTGGCKGYCDRLCCHLVKRRLEEARDVTREVITTSVRTISPRRNGQGMKRHETLQSR